MQTKTKKLISLLLAAVISFFLLPMYILNSNTTAGVGSLIKIEGDKYALGTTSNSEIFTFVIEACDEIGNVYAQADLRYYRDTSQAAAGAFSFELADLADGMHYYKISEQQGSTDGWSYDTNEYVVRVIVEGDTVFVSYPQSDGLAWESPGTNGNPLGSANYFGGLSFGDWVGGPDQDSGLAVGGNLSSIALGEYHIGHPWTPGAAIAPHDPRLLVLGDVTTNVRFVSVGGVTILSESSQLLGTQDLNTYLYTGQNALYSSASTSPYYAPLAAPHFEQVADYMRADDATIAKFFSDAETDLKNLSQHYHNTPATATDILVIDIEPRPFDEWTLNYVIVDFDEDFPANYNDYSLIVYNLDMGGAFSLDTTSGLFFNIPEDYYGLIVINVLPGAGATTLQLAGNAYLESDSGSVSYNGKTWGDFDYNHPKASELGDKLIWNFPDAGVDVINPDSMVVMGSVLAPYSAWEPVGSAGSVNGTLVARSVLAIGGWEVHATTQYGRLQGEKIAFYNTYETPTATTTAEEPTTTAEELTTAAEEPTTTADTVEVPTTTATAEEPTTTADTVEIPTTTATNEEPTTTAGEIETTQTTTEEISTTSTTSEIATEPTIQEEQNEEESEEFFEEEWSIDPGFTPTMTLAPEPTETTTTTGTETDTNVEITTTPAANNPTEPITAFLTAPQTPTRANSNSTTSEAKTEAPTTSAREQERSAALELGSMRTHEQTTTRAMESFLASTQETQEVSDTQETSVEASETSIEENVNSKESFEIFEIEEHSEYTTEPIIEDYPESDLPLLADFTWPETEKASEESKPNPDTGDGLFAILFLLVLSGAGAVICAKKL